MSDALVNRSCSKQLDAVLGLHFPSVYVLLELFELEYGGSRLVIGMVVTPSTTEQKHRSDMYLPSRVQIRAHSMDRPTRLRISPVRLW